MKAHQRKALNCSVTNHRTNLPNPEAHGKWSYRSCRRTWQNAIALNMCPLQPSWLKASWRVQLFNNTFWLYRSYSTRSLRWKGNSLGLFHFDRNRNQGSRPLSYNRRTTGAWFDVEKHWIVIGYFIYGGEVQERFQTALPSGSFFIPLDHFQFASFSQSYSSTFVMDEGTCQHISGKMLSSTLNWSHLPNFPCFALREDGAGWCGESYASC